MFLPDGFERWKGPKWFDVCQEPHPRDDARSEPAPETQVHATRAGPDLVDWKTVDVATMIRTSSAQTAATPIDGDVPFSVFMTGHSQATPEYQQVAGTAATTAPASTPTSPTVRDHV